MSEQHLKVIQGGQARTPGSNQENPVSRQPAGVLGLQLHATLAQAYTPLKAKVDALGTDWDTRPASFWQEILTALPVLREAVQPCIKYTEGDRQNFPCCFSLAFIAIRYSLLSALHRAESLIDDTGIAVTSYKSVCLSREVRHLHRRQYVLETLRKLVGEVRTALDLMGSQLPNNAGSRDSERTL